MKTVIKFCLSPTGRIDRSTFFFGGIAMWFLLIPIIMLGMSIEDLLLDDPGYVFTSIGFIVAYLYISIVLAIKRLHDFNESGWWSFFIFVPFGGLYILLNPGTKGANKYSEVQDINETSK